MSRNAHRWHDDVIRSLVQSFPEPPIYVEIGVASCQCFNAVAPHARVAHAVDPDQNAIAHVNGAAGTIKRWPMTSDVFFKTFRGQADVVFIDGKHTYKQAERDFVNASGILNPSGIIAIHDVWPGSKRDTRPEACGDVYRLADDLQDVESGWETFMYRTFPGLMLCRWAEPLPTEQWT